MNDRTTGGSKGFRTALAATNGGARGLVAQARRLQAAQAAICEQLPTELATGWHLARVDESAVVLVTDSAARATRLRYARTAILRAAAPCAGTQPKTLTVKLAPPSMERKLPQRAELTSAAATCLRQAINGMEDGELRRALAKLARRTKQKG